MDLQQKKVFLVDENCHPQDIALVKMRADPLGVEVRVVPHAQFDFAKRDVCGVLVQYPNTYGVVEDYRQLVKSAHDGGALVVCATDLLALTMLEPPGELGVDVVVGNSQRFGVPLGYGGPHAAFFALKDEHKRLMPG